MDNQQTFLTSSQQQNQPELTQAQASTTIKSKHSKAKLIITLLVVLLFVVVVFVVYFWQHKKVTDANAYLTSLQAQNKSLASQLQTLKSDSSQNTTTKKLQSSSSTSILASGWPGYSSSVKFILYPQTTPPVINECAEQLEVGQDGNAGPLLCSNGELNILAWDYFTTTHDSVLALGPKTTASQLMAAMCSDLSNGTIPIEVTEARLVSLYNGWSFGKTVYSEFGYNSC